MSKKILIIGATGSIRNKLRKTLLEKTDYEITKKENNLKDMIFHDRLLLILL